MIGASLVLAPLFSAQAIEVVDASSGSYAQSGYSAQPQSSNNSSAANMQLLNQMQAMQEELLHLRGLLEEQQQQVQALKTQRLEDYKNIDKRLSELQQGSTSVNNNSAEFTAAPIVPMPTSTNNTASAVVDKSVSNDQQDLLAYQKAYDLIKLRQFDKAKEAFLAFNQKYPQSQFVANSHYWLGELYIIDGNFVKAKASFQTIIKQYPTHTKYPEALYKIATVNYELGDRTTAKLQLDQLLSQFGNQSINAVKKARDFLHANYP